MMNASERPEEQQEVLATEAGEETVPDETTQSAQGGELPVRQAGVMLHNPLSANIGHNPGSK
jgi:hypothetical protein